MKTIRKVRTRNTQIALSGDLKISILHLPQLIANTLRTDL
jgi:hypothetical protein